jgi:hypothetical protein
VLHAIYLAEPMHNPLLSFIQHGTMPLALHVWSVLSLYNFHLESSIGCCGKTEHTISITCFLAASAVLLLLRSHLCKGLSEEQQMSNAPNLAAAAWLA